jgi:collagen type I alpha
MTRFSCLTVSACLALVVTAVGCNDGSGVAPDGGGTGRGGASASGGSTGSGGEAGGGGSAAGGVIGTGGGAAAGATGAAGTKGAAGTTGAAGATGAAGTKGTAGSTGAAGTKGAAGASGGAGATGTAGTKGTAGAGGAAGTGGGAGATGTAGAQGTAGAGGGAFICQVGETCTAGRECQTACSSGPNSHSTFCSCADQGGGGLTLACVSVPCGGADAAVNDAGSIFQACQVGLKDGDNCNPSADTLCQSSCTAGTQMHCLCAAHGGGGGAKWTCTTGLACH